MGQIVIESSGVGYFPAFPVGFYFSTKKLRNMSKRWEEVRGNPARAEENLNRFLSLINLQKIKREIHILPVHKSEIKQIQEKDWMRKEGIKAVVADGVITDDPQAAIILLPADCFPVLITNKEGNVACLFHVGYKNTEIIKEAVQLMRRVSGSHLKDLQVAIGPGIQSCCYLNWKTAAYLLFKNRGLASLSGRVYLYEFLERELIELSVFEENIKKAGLCTCWAKDEWGNWLFFSHQREKGTEEEGRFAVMATLKKRKEMRE
jgi:hypothetical protein